MSKDPRIPKDLDILNKGVLSLLHIARLKCINNAHIINDIGSTPYHLIEPVLKRKTAKSLKHIESISPHIINDSEPLWKSLLKRDFPNRPNSRLILKKNGKKGFIQSRILYDKYANELEEQRKNATDNLKQITKNLNNLKNKNKLIPISEPIKSAHKISKRINNFSQPKRNFKSSLLQKARIVNKQRVRNFQTTTINSNLIKLNKPILNSQKSIKPYPIERINLSKKPS